LDDVRLDIVSIEENSDDRVFSIFEGSVDGGVSKSAVTASIELNII
jgi:hypothetical protein